MTEQFFRFADPRDVAEFISLVRHLRFSRSKNHGRRLAERALRAVVLGRKNYLHFGSDTGGERAAVIYSLIATCKLNHIDPYEYLHHVLGRIADHPINRIAELLPWAVADKLNARWQSAPELALAA